MSNVKSTVFYCKVCGFETRSPNEAELHNQHCLANVAKQKRDANLSRIYVVCAVIIAAFFVIDFVLSKLGG